MKERNIHGLWSMSFKDRILHSEVSGATNDEAGQAWLAELKAKVKSSKEGYSAPWVVLHDMRDWGMAPIDAWEGANSVINWVSEHHCILFAVVFSIKVQHFAFETGLKGQSIMRYYFDYEEAYQDCLDKLAEPQRQQDK
ncbi:hypothetical protein L4C34_18350 [Vibrio profundum]|uniref:hypothetical protein n=1 Tax=Vibrio profundum TaxID=2910247 RepID=UPI003D0A1866